MSFEAPSSVPAHGLTPRVLTGIFVQIVRNIFSDIENISNPELYEFLWSDEAKFSKILIEDLYRWKPEDPDKSPAVLIKRGDWRINQIGLADRVQGPPPAEGLQDFYGVKTIQGQHHFFCTGDTPLSAELISSEVLYHLIHFTPEIRKNFCLEKFEVTSLGALNRVEEAHTEFVVPITVTYQHLLQWTLDRQAPEWKRLVFNVKTVNS